MKIAVLGANGMLGRAVVQILSEDKRNTVITTTRENFTAKPSSLNGMCARLSQAIGEPDYVINCIGAIKPMFKDTTRLDELIYTNAVFPHQLAQWATFVKSKVIHITTDCVFSGESGEYTEHSPHDALDEYGKSKSLGEPSQLAMVIRTSIIGPETPGNARSFLEWVRSMSGQKVNGFTNHFWNGLTTFELAFALSEIIDENVWMPGLFHVFSDDITKAALVELISDTYGLGVKVRRVDADMAVDRTLRTVKDLNSFISPAPLDEQIAQMYVLEGGPD